MLLVGSRAAGSGGGGSAPPLLLRLLVTQRFDVPGHRGACGVLRVATAAAVRHTSSAALAGTPAPLQQKHGAPQLPHVHEAAEAEAVPPPSEEPQPAAVGGRAEGFLEPQWQPGLQPYAGEGGGEGSAGLLELMQVGWRLWTLGGGGGWGWGPQACS